MSKKPKPSERNADKPEAYAPVADGFWTCPSCGGRSREVYSVCRDCGQAVRNTETPRQPQSVAEDKTKESLLTAGKNRPRDAIRVVAVILAFPAAFWIMYFIMAPISYAFVKMLQPVLQDNPTLAAGLNKGIPAAGLVVFLFALVFCMNKFDDWMRLLFKKTRHGQQ